MEIRARAQLAARAQERTYQPASFTLVRGHCNPDLVERPLLRVPVISAAEAEGVSWLMVKGPMALSGKVVAMVVGEVDSVASQVVSLVGVILIEVS